MVKPKKLTKEQLKKLQGGKDGCTWATCKDLKTCDDGSHSGPNTAAGRAVKSGRKNRIG